MEESNNQPEVNNQQDSTTPVNNAAAPDLPSAEPVTTPPQPSQPPAAVVSPPASKQSGKKMLLVIVALVVLAVGAGVALQATVFKSKTVEAPKTVLKELPLLRVGSTEGPIGEKYIFPNETSTQGSQSISYQIYEGLVGYQDQKIAPLLATSWTTPDKNTWVFELQHNIKFQNGKTMTATDVKASFDAVIANSFWSQYTATVKDVKVTGPNEVTVTTAQPDSLLLKRLVNVFVFSENADKTDSGTGPYMLDPAKPSTDTSTSLVAFNDYHQGRPKTQAVQYTIFDTLGDEEAAYKAKTIDSFEAPADPKKVVAYKAAGNVSLTYEAPGSHGVVLNIDRPNGVLGNKQVRQALSYAFDRTEIVKKLGGSFEPTQQLVPKSVVGYSATAVFPGLDLAKAKALQTSAGFPSGVPLTFLYIKGIQTETPILIDQLNAAGFKVTGQAVASPKEALAVIKAGTYDLLGQTYFSNFNDGTDMFTSMLDGENSDFNVYSSPEYSALIKAAEQEFNPAAHIKKVQDINQYIVDNSLWIPLRTSSSTIYSRSDLPTINTNFTSSLDASYYWKVGQTVTAVAQ